LPGGSQVRMSASSSFMRAWATSLLTWASTNRRRGRGTTARRRGRARGSDAGFRSGRYRAASSRWCCGAQTHSYPADRLRAHWGERRCTSSCAPIGRRDSPAVPRWPPSI
jgi:hypothetical protein